MIYTPRKLWDFPGGPVVKTPSFHCGGGVGLIPGGRTEIPHAAWPDQKKERKL